MYTILQIALDNNRISTVQHPALGTKDSVQFNPKWEHIPGFAVACFLAFQASGNATFVKER